MALIYDLLLKHKIKKPCLMFFSSPNNTSYFSPIIHHSSREELQLITNDLKPDAGWKRERLDTGSYSE